MTPRTVVVADRHPSSVSERSGGGSVVELLRTGSGSERLLWVSPCPEGGDARLDLGRIVVCRAGVSAETHRSYYLSVGAAVLWPVLHGLEAEIAEDAVHGAAWIAYERVNRRVAETVAGAAEAGATVIVHDYTLLLSVPEIRRLRPDLRLLYVHHTPWPDQRAVKDPLRRLLVRRLFAATARADGVVVSSRMWRRNLRTWGELAAVCVVHPGVDVAAVRANAAAADPATGWRRLLRGEALQRPVVALVGRADPAKNADTLLRAWARLVARGARGTLCIHQVPSSRRELGIYRAYGHAVAAAGAAAVAARPGCAVVRDSTDWRDAMWLLREADVVVGCSRADGWNLVVPEAAALRPGRELVISSRTGAADVFGRVARVVDDPEAPDALAAQLEAALSSRAATPATVPVSPTPAEWWSRISEAAATVSARA
ncbi:MAG TPA: trehalose-6-phosphate synthase [Actinomycetota bacterium]|nr:trehalose-6-phosphate synthase [Actinomycetota bacterium]